MSTEYPKVSIVILNWNGLNNTIECLESVKRSDYPNYDIVVVDNGSLNGEADLIKQKIPGIKLIKNTKNIGFTGGNNLGIKYSFSRGAQYIWLLNNDTVVEPNALSELVAYGENNHQIGLLSPVIYHYSAPSQIQSCGAYLDEKNFTSKILRDVAQIHNLQNDKIILFGTALLIKCEVIDKIGVLDERYFAYAEDEDYSIRSFRNGFINAVVPNAKIFHKARLNQLKDSSEHYWFYTARNNYWFWLKHTKLYSKTTILRKYLALAIRRAGWLKENSCQRYLDAWLCGVYSAIKNIEGEYNKNIRTPLILKIISQWHPFFVADLLDGNFKKIVREFCKRFRGHPCPKSA